MIIFVISASDRESFNQLPTLIEEKRKLTSTTRPFTSLVFLTKLVKTSFFFVFRENQIQIFRLFADTINVLF